MKKENQTQNALFIINVIGSSFSHNSSLRGGLVNVLKNWYAESTLDHSVNHKPQTSNHSLKELSEGVLTPKVFGACCKYGVQKQLSGINKALFSAEFDQLMCRFFLKFPNLSKN